MTLARRWAATGLGALVIIAAACTKPASAPEPDPTAVKETEAWRAKHETDYRRDWVTIAGLHFLHDGAQTAGSAKGSDIEFRTNEGPPIFNKLVINLQPKDGLELRAEAKDDAPFRQPGLPIVGARPIGSASRWTLPASGLRGYGFRARASSSMSSRVSMSITSE